MARQLLGPHDTLSCVLIEHSEGKILISKGIATTSALTLAKKDQTFSVISVSLSYVCSYWLCLYLFIPRGH